MRIRGSLLALAASVLCVPTATGLAEFGIEGMGVVSTPADELRATVAPDGQRIVWDSDRAGGPGGLDLWQATLAQGRWSEPQLLALNTPADESAPFFSADSRWLYFVSNRAGGLGGNDLYRAAVTATGIGAVENLGASVNTPGDERAPTLSLDGTHLLFASDGHGGAGRHDLFVAHWSGRAFTDPQPVPGTNTDADETEAAWLGDGRALVLARSGETSNPSVQLWLAQCANGRYGEPQPLPVSFNTADGSTRGPVVDANKPGELLISGSARAPKAGKHDIYRIKAPMVTGSDDCR